MTIPTPMRAFFLAVSLSLACPAAQAEASPRTPGSVSFEVLRGGHPFGRQNVTVTRSGDQLIASTSADLRASLGPINFFHYTQACRETWVDGALQHLSCNTTRGGRPSPVEGVVQGGSFQTRGPLGPVEMPLGVLPTSWWSRPPLTTREMLNTETGARLPVRITLIGRETINAGGRHIQADHIRVAGTLSVDLWYDEAGHWVSCAFSASGQHMTYRLLSNPASAPA